MNGKRISAPQPTPQASAKPAHFQSWVYYDASLGAAHETFGTCILDLAAELRLSREFIDILAKLNASRLGLYVHQGHEGQLMRFRELVTGQTLRCLNVSGYKGSRGELWLTRILPPPAASFEFSINFTTPHVICNPGEAGWLAYLERTLPKVNDPHAPSPYESLMKYGLTHDMWNEYIFEAYANFDPGAIFLCGVPDIASSRPHSSESRAGGYRPLR